MPDCSMVSAAEQLGGVLRSVVDLATGEVLPGCALSGREEASSARVGGLSTSHIPTVEGDENTSQAATIQGWVGGSLVKVKHAGPYTLGVQAGGGKRKKISGFSRGSRRRLQRKIATIQRACLPVFVTLTYPDQFPDDVDEWNIHLERLRSRLARKGWGAVWRKEFKRRKSGVNAGKVAPHYHLLIWGASLAEIRAYMGRAWWECCGRISEDHLKSGVRVEMPRSWDGVAGYTSKYLAKADDEDVKEFLKDHARIGRMWGVLNAEVIPWAEVIEMTIETKTVNTFFRYLRRYAHIRARSSWPSCLCAIPGGG